MNESELIAYINQYFVYNSDGSITRTDRKNSNGSYDKDGYLIMKIKGKQYKAHRIVYALCNGVMPGMEIDHINRIRKDNRIENLRQVTRQQNVMNTTRYPNKETGVIGVHLDKTRFLKKNYATRLGGKYLRFSTVFEAVKAREEYYEKQGVTLYD